MLNRVHEWVEPHLGQHAGAFWVVDDTGRSKHGSHSASVPVLRIHENMLVT